VVKAGELMTAFWGAIFSITLRFIFYVPKARHRAPTKTASGSPRLRQTMTNQEDKLSELFGGGYDDRLRFFAGAQSIGG
jgi:hypothetical protein